MTRKQNEPTLYAPTGQRLYLTPAERSAFIEVARAQPPPVHTFCHMLAYTGCRISEALALTNKNIDLQSQVVVFETLKRRHKGVFRAVPLPDPFLQELTKTHHLSLYDATSKPLWPMSRSTAYRRIIDVLEAAGIAKGPHHCPKGLRHSFGVTAVLNGVPVGKLKAWMGHARLETTLLYTQATGDEERALAQAIWN